MRSSLLADIAYKFGGALPRPSDLRVLLPDTFLAATRVNAHTWLSVSAHKQLRLCAQHHAALAAQAEQPHSALTVLIPAKLVPAVMPAACKMRLLHRFPAGSKPYIDGSARVLPALTEPVELWTSLTLPARLGAACHAADPSMLFDVHVCGERAVALIDTGATRCFVSPRLVAALGSTPTPVCRNITRHATRSPEDHPTPTGQSSNGGSQREASEESVAKEAGTRSREWPQGRGKQSREQEGRPPKADKTRTSQAPEGPAAQRHTRAQPRAAAQHTLGGGSTGRPPELRRRRRASGAGRRHGCREGGPGGSGQLVPEGRHLGRGLA